PSARVRCRLYRFAAADIPARPWDMTSDIGIPAYHCTISDPSALGGLEPVYGAGCHLSKEIALARALTEAAQCRLTFIAGSRDDVARRRGVPASHRGRAHEAQPRSPGRHRDRSRLARGGRGMKAVSDEPVIVFLGPS